MIIAADGLSSRSSREKSAIGAGDSELGRPDRVAPLHPPQPPPGNATLPELESYILPKRRGTTRTASGRQEMLENLINESFDA